MVVLVVYLLAVIETEYSAGYRHNLSEHNHLFSQEMPYSRTFFLLLESFVVEINQFVFWDGQANVWQMVDENFCNYVQIRFRFQVQVQNENGLTTYFCQESGSR